MVLYQHSQLLFADSIRLVRICPKRDQNGPLQLSICLTRLQDAPKYEALSYEWGNRMHEQPILCNGQELYIQANLAAALKRLQHVDRWLWIDAICIDQQNIPERNQQVSMMRDIYAQAEQVLAWIGDVIPCAEEVFEVIPILAWLWQAREVARLKAGDERPPMQIELSISEKASLPPQRHPLWKSLFTLYSATYFQRTWIIQEIVVSTHAIVPYRSAGDCSTGEHRLYASKASDPRDKVFGVLGLGLGTNKPLVKSRLAQTLLQVDYNKSVQEVYRDAAKYTILSQQGLTICYGQALTEKSVKGLPSWVPDWSVRIEAAPSFLLSTYYKVRLWLPGNITFDSDNSMFVDGLILDTVDFTTGTMSCEAPLPDIQQIIFHLGKRLRAVETNFEGPGLQFFEMVERLGHSTYKTGESLFEALWRTLIGNIAAYQPARPDFQRHFWGVIAIIMLRERGIVFDRYKWHEKMYPDPQMATQLRNDEVAQRLWQSACECQAHHYFAELVNTVQGRAFFTTAQGYMGFGARGTKVGDKVCILGGTWTPFILRHHQTYHEMIGMVTYMG